MKKIYTIIAGVLLTVSVFAQTPQKMSYQAVIRDANNSLTTNQAVGMQISILQGSATGTPVYVETQTPTTNANGLVSLEIGTGTAVSGDFTTIDWANDTYFIKTETDPTGGTSYTITGTTQLMSVPYALHAKTAESITGTINYTETDPIYGVSIAGGITAADTANWNNHIVDTDTQLDSTGVATLGYVVGAHTVDTDTQLDSTGVASLGFVAGAHTVNTDTQLDSTGIATLGYVAGAHTINTDTQLDSAGVASLGFVSGTHTVNTDTQLDSTGIANLSYVAGAHTINTDTQLDSAGVASLGYVAGTPKLTVSPTGDTLTITGGNSVLVPGISLLNFPPVPPVVGDFRDGGIVFWIDGTGGGLVVGMSDLSTSAQWGCSGTDLSGAGGTAIGTGAQNTIDIETGCTTSGTAAGLCANATIAGYSDWFLPSKDELMSLSGNSSVNIAIVVNGGTAMSNVYWSSSENGSNAAWYYSFSFGSLNNFFKTSAFGVRAVRAF